MLLLLSNKLLYLYNNYVNDLEGLPLNIQSYIMDFTFLTSNDSYDSAYIFHTIQSFQDTTASFTPTLTT